MVFTTLGNDGFLNNMALWGKSFGEIGTLFKSSFGNAFTDVNSKFDTAISNTEKLKATMSGMGQGLKGVFTTTKDSPLELLTDDEAKQRVLDFAKATQNGAVALQDFNFRLKDKGMKAYLQTVDAGKASLEGYTKYVNQHNVALQKTTLASKAATLGMKALSMAGNMIAGIGIGLAINALITVVSKLATAQQDAIDKANELTDTYKSCSAEITGNISSLEKMDDELTRLAKGVDENGKNVKLTADEYARYRDIISEVVDMNPSLIKGYNDEGQELVNNNTLIRDAIDLQRELNRLKMEEYLNSGEDILKGSKNEKGQAKQEITSIVTGSLDNAPLLDNLTGGREWFGTAKTDQVRATLAQFEISLNDILLGNIDSLEILTQKRHEIISSLEQEGILDKTKAQELNTQIGLIDIQLNKMDAASQKTSKYLSFWAANDEGNKSWYNEIDTGYLDDFSSSLNAIASDGSMSIAEMQVKVMELGESFAGMQDQIPTEAFEDLQTQLASGSISEEEYNAALVSLLEQLDKLKEAYPELADAINSVGAAWRGSIESADDHKTPVPFDLSEISDNLKTFNEEIANVYASMDILDKAADEVANTGKVTAETFKALSDNNLLQYLRFTADGVTVLTDELLANEMTVREKAKADLEAALFTDLLNLATKGLSDAELEAKERADKAGTAVETMSTKFANSVDGVLGATVAVSAFNAANGGTSFDFEGQEEQFNKLLGNYNSAIGAINNMTSATNSSTNAFNRQSTAASDAADAINNQLKAEGDAAIRVIDRKIKAIQDAQKASEEAIDAEIDGIKKEKEAYEDAIDAEIDKLNERKKTLEDSIKDYESAAGAVKDLINEQMDAIDKRKDEVNEFYDEQLDALDKTNKALQDQIDREEALEALQRAKSQKVMVFKDGKFDYLENDGAVKDAQDNYDQVLADQALQAEKDRLEEEREAKLEALDAEKKLLEDYKKLWEDATTAYEREQQELINIKVFGKDWEQAILEQRTDILHKFTEEQYNQTVELEENVLTQLEILTKQKEDEAILFEERIAALEEQKAREAENYAARIEDLNGYKERVQERLNMIGQSWEEYQTQLDLEAKWEAALFDNMAAEIEDYADRVEEAMRRAQAAKANGGAGGGSKSPSNDNYDYRTDSSLTAGQKKQAALMEKEFGGKAAGGTVHKTDVYNVDELGDELIVSPPKNGRFKLLEMGTTVFGAAMSQQMMKSFNEQSNTLATDHFSAPKQALNMSVFGAPQGAGQVTHIDVHNITLPNVRTGDDAQKIVDVLKRLPIKSHQHTQSMFFR